MLPEPVLVSHGDVELAVRSYGDPGNPALICLHGWPDSSRGWRHVAHRLGDRFHVLTPDLRGFANSSKPVGTEAYGVTELLGDLMAVADWAGADRFYVAGHDFGSAITWWAGTFAADRVHRIVAMAAPHPMVMKSAAGDVRQITRAAYTYLLNLGEPGEALMRSENFDFLRRFAFGGVDAITDDDFEAYRAEWEQPGAFTAMAEYYRSHYRPDLFNRDVPLDLPPVRVPTRYVHGMRDFAFIPELATGNEAFVDAEYDEVHLDATHWLLYERPEEVAELIAEWCTDRDL